MSFGDRLHGTEASPLIMSSDGKKAIILIGGKYFLRDEKGLLPIGYSETEAKVKLKSMGMEGEFAGF